nr:reverse transcriptase domain-containing protein [Tanacetum cinerariifolium]
QSSIDVIDMAYEEYSQEVLGFFDTISSGNLTPFYDPIVSTTSSTLTPFENSDFLLEEVDAFLAVEDEPTSSDYYQPYLNTEGDILLLEAFLNDDPSPPSCQGNYMPEVRKELKICEAHSEKSSVDEPHVAELKELPPYLEYAFLEGDDKLPVIIPKDLSVKEKTALITILKSHKRVIAWKLSDIKGINPEFCTHKILMEEDFEPAVQHQRRVNPKIHDVIKQEVIKQEMIKLLEAGLIYPISDSPWMLKRCEDTNLCLNWEKSHFMVKEGIVLGHKISKQGIEAVHPKPVTSPISEPIITPVSASRPNPQASIPYLSRRNNERNRESAKDQIEKFYQIFKDISFEISFADALMLMPKFASTLKALIENKEKLSEMARTPLNEHCSAVLLKKLPEKLGDPGKFFDTMLSLSDLTPTCMMLELADRSITSPVGIAEDVYVKTRKDLIDVFEDEPTSSEFYQPYLDPKGNILLLEAFLNDDPSPPPYQGNYMPEVRKELKICEAHFEKSSVDEPHVAELKELPPHLEYAFLEGDDKLPVIIAKDLSVDEKTALITILKSHKRAIAWKLSDIKGNNPEFCTHKILMEEDFELAVQHQRRVNPKIHDVIKQEVIKLLEAGLIYPISDSPWVSLVHCVPKKGGFIVVENEDNELIPTRLVTGWRVCIDYRKLNEATWKDHFPLPFMDQMLERLAGNQYYCFLDGFSGYFQIPIDPKDQEKTTFTCPNGTFAYRRMPFGLCNALGTFQRCMMAIFHDMIEKTMEVFMDDFSVFGNSFQSCLSHLDQMLKRCEDTNLCLNWEKNHFMVKE